MTIYIVEEGDTINSIADKFGFPVDKLVLDNGLVYPYNLVIGQAIVIAFPKKVYTVLQGDTLQSIADAHHISVMQLLRNNPFLSEREYIYPGEILVISYDTTSSITVNGYAYPFIKNKTLIKTLPNLTYLSVLNYTATENGDINTFYDDSYIITKAKEYSVMPIMVLSTISLHGEQNYAAVSSILQNEEYQDNLIDNTIKYMREKGYYGVNIIYNYLNEENQLIYLNFTSRLAKRVQQEGFLFFLTINYKISQIGNEIIERINYAEFSKYVNSLMFLEFVWGINYDPPEPVCNMYHIEILVDYLEATNVPKEKIVIGKPVMGYEWQLPFIPGKTSANSLTLYSAYNLAYEHGAIIGFDDESQRPYFYYNEVLADGHTEHIVWFLDARTINALYALIADNGLNGGGIWNIMIYYPQLWIIFYSQYDIIKIEDLGADRHIMV